jgi:hypothetical protein
MNARDGIVKENNMRFYFIILTFYLVIGSSLLAHPNGGFELTDRFLQDAIAERNLSHAELLLDQSEAELKALNQSTNQNADRTNIDIISRSGLIDALRLSIQLEENDNFLESIRTQTKALALANSLRKSAGVHQATQTPYLDGAISALYKRLTDRGVLDRNADVTFTTQESEKLLYRTINVQDKRLTVYELNGNPHLQTAVWQAKDYEATGSLVLRGADDLPTTDGRRAKFAFPQNEYPFYLVLNGDFVKDDPDEEERLLNEIDRLPSLGIVPVILAPRGKQRPFTKIPHLPEVSMQGRGHDKVALPAVLYYRPTGAEIWRWKKISSFREVGSIVQLSKQISTEFSADLNHKLAGAAAPSLYILLPTTRARKTEDKRRYTVRKELDAVRVERSGAVQLKHDTPLIAIALFDDEWGQYKIEGNEEALWIRLEDISPYIIPTAPKKSGVNTNESQAPKRENVP